MYIGINYEERVNGYHSVSVIVDNYDIVVFATGDPVADFKSAIDFANRHATPAYIFLMSSVTSFTLEVPGYTFDENDMLIVNEEELKATHSENFNYKKWRSNHD